MKILHLEQERYTKELLNSIEQLGLVDYRDFSTQGALDEYLKNNKYDVIITKLGFYIGETQIQNQDKLKYILTPTTGLNHIDLNAASGKGIEVISLKGESQFLQTVQSTAEHTWLLLLAIARNLRPALDSVNKGNWVRAPFLASELNTQTIGIIGLGRLGKIILNYARAFHMNIKCFDIDNSVFTEDNIKYKSSFEDVVSSSDYIILMVDYRPENECLIGAEEFEKMKNNSFFINSSRGEMVDETALLNALKNNQIKGAALDVLNDDSSWERNSPNFHPLIEYAGNHNNLIITPHMGGYGSISIMLTRKFIIEKFKKIII